MTPPWEQHPTIWPSKAKYMSFLRSGIRSGLWNKHPLKQACLDAAEHKVVNTNPRSMKRFPKVSKWKCAMCGGFFAKAEVQVDHKVGGHSLTDLSELHAFIMTLVVNITLDDLQVLCKNCHSVKTLAERSGTSLDEAAVKKAMLKLQEAHSPVKKLVAFLVSQGYNANMLKNKAQRLKALEDYVLKQRAEQSKGT